MIPGITFKFCPSIIAKSAASSFQSLANQIETLAQQEAGLKFRGSRQQPNESGVAGFPQTDLPGEGDGIGANASRNELSCRTRPNAVMKSITSNNALQFEDLQLQLWHIGNVLVTFQHDGFHRPLIQDDWGQFDQFFLKWLRHSP